MQFGLDFPITRRYPWPYFTPIVLTVSAVIFVGLTILNVRLVGPETITSLEEDFNTIQSFWLDGVIPKALTHGQDLCQPLVLKMGDSFVTNSSMFLWDLELVTKANHGSSGLVYKGSTLQGCDVIAIYLNGNMKPPTLDVTAVISCKDLDGFDIMGKTAFTFSVMPGTYTRFTSSVSNAGHVLHYRLIEMAAEDLLSHIHAMMTSDQGHYPRYWELTLLVQTSSYPTHGDNASAINETNLYAPIANIVQTVHASVQVDLGNAHKNNFLLNPSTLNKTLYSEFPATFLPKRTVSTLYQAISNGSFSTLPLKVEGPAKLEARYLCRLQRMKPPAQALVAVLVATLSMFLSGWGFFMLVATYWAKRNNDLANSCVTHDIEHGSRMPEDGQTRELSEALLSAKSVLDAERRNQDD